VYHGHQAPENVAQPCRFLIAKGVIVHKEGLFVLETKIEIAFGQNHLKIGSKILR
jgi:hypothetical protein